MLVATFHSFAVCLPIDAIVECSGPGRVDDSVAYWAPRIERPETCTPARLAAELKGYGAWDATELADDEENWRRIVWIAAGNLREEMRP